MFAEDPGTDWGPVGAHIAGVGNAASGDASASSMADRVASISVGVGTASANPQVNVSSLLMTSGHGAYWGAVANGDTSAVGTFEVLAAAGVPVGTTAVVRALLITNTGSMGGGAATVAASVHQSESFSASLGSASSGNGYSLTTLQVNGQDVFIGSSTSGATFMVEFPVAVGSTITSSAGEDSSSGSGSYGSSIGMALGTAHSSFIVQAHPVGAPVPLARATLMIWNPDTEDWETDLVVWEESPPE